MYGRGKVIRKCRQPFLQLGVIRRNADPET
jgi:hypothetical protein